MISNYLMVRTYFTYLVEGNQKSKNRGLVLNLTVKLCTIVKISVFVPA
jgi:hypothetical protein